MMRKIIMFWLCALLGFTAVSAATRKDDRQAIPTIKSVAVEFSPEWTVQILGGGAYTLGEADFADLLSPAAQLSVGYRFSRLLGARISFQRLAGQRTIQLSLPQLSMELSADKLGGCLGCHFHPGWLALRSSFQS